MEKLSPSVKWPSFCIAERPGTSECSTRLNQDKPNISHRHTFSHQGSSSAPLHTTTTQNPHKMGSRCVPAPVF